MTNRTERRAAAGGTVAEARSAAALFLTFTAVIAAAIGLACLADRQSGVAIAAVSVAVVSFVVSIICFSADAEPLAEAAAATVDQPSGAAPLPAR
jgi:Na+/melibiose symporter-like transporter